MKNLAVAAFSLLLLTQVSPVIAQSGSQAAPSASTEGVDPLVQVKRLGRGLNVLGYDPLWRDSTKARFKAEHFRRIHEGGFQTIRVNLHSFRQMDEENRLPARWFETLDWIIENALTNKLNVILDEHDFQEMGKNAEGGTTKLQAFWKQVADRYRAAPPTVLFELLNEPNGQLTEQLWNNLSRELLSIVRASNPTRNVVIGPANYNNIHSLSKLELPADDRHLIITVHYYLPYKFTHQGAPWSPSTVKLSGIEWGTSTNDYQALEKDFSMVQEWAKVEKRPILLGEFGAYDKADLESRVRYTSAVARAAEAKGWAWTYWQFDSDFVAFDMKQNDWFQPIYRALVPVGNR